MGMPVREGGERQGNNWEKGLEVSSGMGRSVVVMNVLRDPNSGGDGRRGQTASGRVGGSGEFASCSN